MLSLLKRRTVFAACLLLILVLPAAAQTTNARIVGTVTDASHAPVPGAAVTVRSMETNARRTTVTSDAGYYVFPELPIGSYEVSAEASGFKRYVQGSLKLLVDLTLRVDIRLEVGDVKDQVTVLGEAPVIATDQSSIGEVTQNRALVQLPLVGRHVLQLAQLAPGATQGQYDAVNRFRNYGTVLTSNGGRPEQNNYMIDGADNTGYILGMTLVVPSVDAIEEFKVQTANYSADLGQASGAVVNIAIKSGTNAFHGTAYEFLRNDKLDARNFFAARKLPLRQNQFGFSLGGPIRKDRLFFFFNYEGLRSIASAPYFYFVPTPAMRAGDFSGTWANNQLPPLYDPANLDASGNRLPFTGNRIPGNRISPIATNLLSYMPDPNSTLPQGNYEHDYSTPTNRAQVNVRGDYRVTAKDQVMARYSYWNSELLQQYLNFAGTFWYHRPRNAVAGWTHSYSPSILQEVRFAFSRYSEVTFPPGYGTDYASKLGLPEYPLSGEVYFPFVSISNVDVGLGSNQPSPRIENHYQGQYHLSIIHGRHALKTGADFLRLQAKDGFNTTMGSYSFSGGFTSPIGQTYSNGFGSFLLGLPASQRIQVPVNWDYERLRNLRVQSFLQDDISVAPNLTINLGLRYEYYGPWWDLHQRMQYFDFSTGQEVYPATLKLPYTLPFSNRFDANFTALQVARPRQFGPRVGFAWRPFHNDRTVVRAAYGIFWGLVSGYLTANQSSQGAGLNLSDIETSSSTAPSLAWGVFTSTQSPGSLVPLFPSTFTTDPHVQNPNVQQWNFGIERQLSKDMAIKVAYVGSRTTHLDGRLPGNLSYPPAPGNNLLRLAYPNFRNLTRQQSAYWSSYHALQVSVERRFAQGLMFRPNYTW